MFMTIYGLGDDLVDKKKFDQIAECESVVCEAQ